MARNHSQEVSSAFTRQAESFNLSATANDAQILEKIVELSDPSGGERWLEAACGPGAISRRLARSVASVHGIDFTPAMIEMARREAAAAGLGNLTFEVGDATATSLPDAGFDGAVTRFSLHHIPVPSRLVVELARVVRPGGTITVLDHLADEDGDTRDWAQEIERLRDPSHWACLSAGALCRLGHDAGLELIEEERFAFELDFDDWLQRGTDDRISQELVERSLADRPQGSECFQVRASSSGRVLRLQMWRGVW